METPSAWQNPHSKIEATCAILDAGEVGMVAKGRENQSWNGIEPTCPVNVATVPQRSPFRYPGGKTWLIPLFRRWMESLETKPRMLIEPFAGGGIVGLTASAEVLADEVLMVELDGQVAAVWETVLGGDEEWLAERIASFDFNADSVETTLRHPCPSRRCRAFRTILRNRISHGGILAKGAGVTKQGEAGRGLASRWYPETLAKRIRALALVEAPVRFLHGDAFEVLETHREREDVVYFVDPPYTAGGKRAGARLYDHWAVDHERLFAVCSELGGDFLMTYDNCDEVRALASRHGFETRAVAMKNTHHDHMTELLIGRSLHWID